MDSERNEELMKQNDLYQKDITKPKWKEPKEMNRAKGPKRPENMKQTLADCKLLIKE